MAMLPENKTAKELGLKIGDRFRIAKPGRTDFGRIFEFVRDDGTTLPWFNEITIPAKNYEVCIHLYALEPLTSNITKGNTMNHFPNGTRGKDINAKVGDTFTVINGDSDFKPGETVTLISDDLSRCPYFENESGIKHHKFWGDLAPLTPTWDTLQVGDKLARINGNESRTILAVLGDLLAIEDSIIVGRVVWYTKEKAQEYYMLPKVEEPAKTELTLEEVAKKFNVPVDQLRIKD